MVRPHRSGCRRPASARREGRRGRGAGLDHQAMDMSIIVSKIVLEMVVIRISTISIAMFILIFFFTFV